LPSENYGEGLPPSVIGDPATYVYTDRCSASAILHGIKQRNVYVSRGPEIDLRISIDGKRYGIGSDLTDAIRNSSSSHFSCTIRLHHISSGQVIAMENGKPISTDWIHENEPTFEYSIEWKHKPYAWLRFEIRSVEGNLLAFTNPFYHGSKSKDAKVWKDIL
jgi:hypothetical protein